MSPRGGWVVASWAEASGEGRAAPLCPTTRKRRPAVIDRPPNHGVTQFSPAADPVTLAEIAHLPLAARPAAACIDPRTGHAFISVDSNQSLEIDLATMRIVAAIDTGREPDCCVVLSVN